MIIRKLKIMVWVLLLSGLTPLIARPITYYQLFTRWETTPFNEIIWYWTPDTMHGPFRSNDYIGIKFSPQFYGPVITAQDRFREFDANPWFAIEPVFNAPMINLPQSYPNIRDRANVRIDSDGGQKMTRFIMADGELEISQYAIGGEQERIRHVETISPLHGLIVAVNGKAEIMGELTGTLTIYATDDIYLIDDIRYANANNRGMWIDGQDPGGHLGIVSEGDIIIKDNWANGKRNMERGRDIIINASLVALGESFTFEHHNDDWDAYQGPVPDQRGYIYLKGSIAQWRRGYVHRSNHGGTGYGKSYQYDRRLEFTGPPGFQADYIGRYDHLHIRSGSHQLLNVTATQLTVDAGAEIILQGNNPLTVRGDINCIGTAENPIIFRNVGNENISTLLGIWGNYPTMKFNYVDFADNVEVILNADSLIITNCSFASEVSFEGNILVERSTFKDEVLITSFDHISVNHNIFVERVTIDGNTAYGSFVNNTVVGSSHEGLLLRQFRSFSIINNIIVFNRNGIVSRDRESPVLRYNNVFDNRQDNYSGCQAGEGSISADPLFLNYEQGDYNLTWNSPCIDAGDPDSPPDPDGSRTDMGAFAIDHELSIPRETILPDEFSVSAFPNPFNDVIKVNVTSHVDYEILWSVFDVQGKMVLVGTTRLINGQKLLKLNGKQLSSSGIYFLSVKLENHSTIIKLVYMS